jgi:hypothetical protein
MSTMMPKVSLGFDPNVPFELKTLFQRYPNTVVEIDNTPKISTFSPMDQTVSNDFTVLSSLVSSCMPTLIANTGILACAFRYSSWSPSGNPMGDIYLEHIETFQPLPPDMIKKKWDRLFNKLYHSLFQSIKAAAGHFDLMCQCGTATNTHSILNLKDYNVINNDIYETYNTLGGFNSPLIGSERAFVTNANALRCFVDTLRGVK